ncbi:LysR substrate-binding domain-containing protein [Klebsiella quasipneumoniae subsp. similipneumoniae]
MAVVGSPAYLQRAGTPQTPGILPNIAASICACRHEGTLRLEFARDGREIQVQVEGQLILNSLPQRIDAAEAGLRLAYVPDDCVAEALASGRLVQVLAEWTPPSRLPSLLPAGASIPALSRCYWKLCDADLIDKSVKCSR